MKRILLLTLFLFSMLSHAQFSENHFVYLSLGGVTAGNYTGSEINLNYVYKHKYTFEFGVSSLYRKSLSEPADYSRWWEMVILYPGDQESYDQIRSFKILAGRLIEVPIKMIRFNLKGGLTYSRIIEVSNWEKKSKQSFWGTCDYYEYDLVNHRRFGFIIEPSVELPFTRYVGLSLSPYALFNDKASAYGVNVKLIFGLLRSRVKPKIRE